MSTPKGGSTRSWSLPEMLSNPALGWFCEFLGQGPLQCFFTTREMFVGFTFRRCHASLFCSLFILPPTHVVVPQRVNNRLRREGWLTKDLRHRHTRTQFSLICPYGCGRGRGAAGSFGSATSGGSGPILGGAGGPLPPSFGGAPQFSARGPSGSQVLCQEVHMGFYGNQKNSRRRGGYPRPPAPKMRRGGPTPPLFCSQILGMAN